MKLVITIPAYNEEKTIGDVILKIKKIMKKEKYSYKILVVDDGSTDNTANVSKKSGANVFSHPRNYGLAETFRTEIKKSLELKADVIVHIDADGQYQPEEIPKLFKEIKNGYDLVLGSRFLGKIEYMPLIKRLGNKLFSKVVSNITKTKITDAQTGFRAFTKDMAKQIDVISTHTYTQEQIIRAVLEKFKIKEVPVNFKRRKGKSRLLKNPIEYGIKALLNIMRVYRDYEPIKFFGLFSIFFFLIGAVIGTYFLYLHFTVGISGHLGLVIIMIISIITGTQITLFAFFADMLRNRRKKIN